MREGGEWEAALHFLFHPMLDDDGRQHAGERRRLRTKEGDEWWA
jgi:hypothetical protein